MKARGRGAAKRRSSFFSWVILVAVLWLIARYLHFLFF